MWNGNLKNISAVRLRHQEDNGGKQYSRLETKKQNKKTGKQDREKHTRHTTDKTRPTDNTIQQTKAHHTHIQIQCKPRQAKLIRAKNNTPAQAKPIQAKQHTGKSTNTGTSYVSRSEMSGATARIPQPRTRPASCGKKRWVRPSTQLNALQ